MQPVEKIIANKHTAEKLKERREIVNDKNFRISGSIQRTEDIDPLRTLIRSYRKLDAFGTVRRRQA